MPTYVSLIQFTQKGMESIKDGPKRLDAARKAYEEAGAKLKDFYLVMGEYDIVAVVDAPNDETAARMSLQIGSKGNVRTKTLRAFSEAEYRKIISAL
jgi:uncharacterized protein with GYD domain